MFITAGEAAQILRMEPYRVYYLLIMGEIESVKIGKVWRLTPEALDEYVKRHPERKIKEPSGYFIYPGNGGYLFGCVSDNLQADPRRETACMERRRGQLVYRAHRPDKVLLAKLKSVTQLELFAS